MAIDYYPTKTGELFHQSDNRIRGIVGPLGSGKSVACCLEILKRAIRQAPGEDGVRRTRVAVIRNTYGQLTDTTQKTFFDWFPPGKAGHYVDKRNTFTMGMDKNGNENLICLPDGSRVICKHKRDDFRETATPRKVGAPLEVLAEANAIAIEMNKQFKNDCKVILDVVSQVYHEYDNVISLLKDVK